MSAVSFKGVEGWKPDDRLPPDTYLMRAMSPERRESSGKNAQVQIDWRVIDGQFKGAEQRDWITFTEPAMGNIVAVCEACDIDISAQEFDNYGAAADWFCKQLEEKQPVAEVVIRNDSWEGTNRETGQKETREGPKVKGYRRPNPSDIPNDTAGFASGPNVRNGSEKPEPF